MHSAIAGRQSMVEPLRAATPADLPNISQFLLRTYPPEASRAFANPEVLRWKYFEPRLDWTESRSFILEKEGQIVAHAGVLPAQFRFPGGKLVNSLTILDWAGDPAVPAVGAMLMRKLMKMSETAFVIGGSPAARAIRPKIGFRITGEARTYARWLRPWKEFRRRPASLRSAMRLAHGLAHMPFSPALASAPWEALPVQRFASEVLPVIGHPPASFAACQRTIDDLNWMLRCPLLATKSFLLTKHGAVRGYFILAKAAWEARLIDIRVQSEDPEDWKLAYSAVVRAAAQEREICRLSALSTLSMLSDALRHNGFWIQYHEPLMTYDPQHLLADAPPTNFQLFEGDAGFSDNGA